MSDDHTSTRIAELVEAKTAGKSARLNPRDPRNNGHKARVESQQKTQGPQKTVWREYFESAIVTVIMALFGMTFIVQAVKVPTGSMQNTILIGDHLLVNKFIFAAGPRVLVVPQRD